MTALKEEWRSCVYTQQFISQSRSTLLRDNEKRRVENTESIVSIVRFFFFSFKFLSFLYPPFNAAARSVFEASDPRESGAAKQVTRKFCDVPETFDESARHSNPQLPLTLKAILSLPRTVKDVFVERCARVSFSARFRDTLALKSWWRLVTNVEM